jgi:hypothetical protein
MTATLVAALTAILGIAIGRLWDNRAESTRWRRDQRAASYQNFAEQFQAITEVLRALATTDPDTASYSDKIEEIRIEGFKNWDSAFTAIWMHGATEVVTAATQLDRAVTDLFYRVSERQFTTQDWQDARLPARQAFERFLAAVRNDLRLPVVPIRFFPETTAENSPTGG